jgi:HAE1 family hydrophobic/amphiphilic exporter-1
MAIAIIGGLISSTLLTLLVVPSVYSLLDQALARFLRFLGLAERHAADTPGERT